MASGTSSNSTANDMQKLDTGSISSPVTYFEWPSFEADNNGSAFLLMQDYGAVDTGGSASDVTDSSLNPALTRSVMRSGALTLTSGNRYYGLRKTATYAITGMANFAVVAFTGSTVFTGLTVKHYVG
jgi:hypothetical protein